MLALVGHGEALARMVLGLPAGSQLGADLLPAGAPFGRRHGRIEPVQQQFGDALLLAQDGPPGGLRWMAREHRIDADPGEQSPHVVERLAVAGEPHHGVAEPAWLGLRGVVQVFAAAPDAVHLLGEIDHLEPGREGTHQVARLARIAAARAGQQFLLAAVVILAPADRRHAVALDQIKALLPALLQQDLADQGAQGMDILAQRGVFGGKLDILTVHRGAGRWLHVQASANDIRRSPAALRPQYRRSTPA